MAKVLLIEDSPYTRAATRLQLESGGHSVVEAGNGREGLATALSGDFDLVITDILMPENDGLEVLASLVGRPHRPPVIAISGGFSNRRTGFDILEMAIKLGADAALDKPFEEGELLANVEAVLARSAKQAACGCAGSS